MVYIVHRAWKKLICNTKDWLQDSSLKTYKLASRRLKDVTVFFLISLVVLYPILAGYNNDDRFIFSLFIYKRTAGPGSTVNFRKNISNCSISTPTPFGPPCFPYSSIATACLYPDKEVDCNYQSLSLFSFTPPWTSHSSTLFPSTRSLSSPIASSTNL